MALLFCSSEDDPRVWQELLRDQLPELEFRVHPEIGRPEEIEYALVYAPPQGLLGSLPNLRVAFSLFAGVEHVLPDRSLPDQLPIVRMVSPDLTRGMVEYVALHALKYYRRLDDYRELQQRRCWEQLDLPQGSDRVGILGCGVLGTAAAKAVVDIGMDVACWSRTQKFLEGVASYFGQDQLTAFLQRSQILVCLLPLTDATAGIVDGELLAKLPKGAFFINPARGAHVVDADLLHALDAGQLAGATLDVFRDEPLPPDHPFWAHSRIEVTPHVASVTRPCPEAAQWIARNIKRVKEGLPPLHAVNRAEGY